MLDHKDGWNPEAFRGRYSEVLDRYDYIIGDWGYSQLRLKGFYRDNHPKVNRDTAISGMVDYINEYCNFGCAYFVLHKLKEAPQEGTYKDILIKELPEPGSEEDLEQETAEPAVNAKDQRESHPKGSGHAANRDKDAAGGSGREHAAKDRPVREHQSRNHRNKEGQGKKNHKELQGRGPQGNNQGGNPGGNQGSNNHKQNNPNRQNNTNKQDNQNNNQTKQDNQSNQNNNQPKQDNQSNQNNNPAKQDN